jgi:hypothetical protein
MESRNEKGKRWRPWQFGVRFLMLLAVMAGVFCAGRLSARSELESLRRQQAVFRKEQAKMAKAIEEFKAKKIWHLKTYGWVRKDSARIDAMELFRELDRMHAVATQAQQ